MKVLSPLDFPQLSAAPSSPAEGEVYYDTVKKKLQLWNGSAWLDIPGSGGGGGGAPTFTAPETVARSDRLVIPALRLTDTINRADAIKASAKLTDTIDRADAYRLPSATFKAPDAINRADLMKMDISWPATPRSGTPDTDSWGDAWTNAELGQTGVNHGNEANLDITNGALGERRGLIEVDLTRFSGLTAAPNTVFGVRDTVHVFRVYAKNAGLLAITATFTFYQQAARWFTESTVTQANQPNPGSPVATFTRTLAGGADGDNQDSIQLLASEMQALLGKWVLVKCTTPALSLGPFTVYGRESGPTPLFFFQVQR